ncbi:hypothetical protein K474DRAFT_1315966 [Panus rudis PR-1116 ss-1]|nr:hypothetical protein K474DRAFT_1315966 [Panus rudis PR-1116 ss-1]
MATAYQSVTPWGRNIAGGGSTSRRWMLPLSFPTATNTTVSEPAVQATIQSGGTWLNQDIASEDAHQQREKSNDDDAASDTASLELLLPLPPPNVRPSCELCELTFDDIAALEAHYRDTDLHPTCVYCFGGFNDDDALQQHVNSDHAADDDADYYVDWSGSEPELSDGKFHKGVPTV